jgi:hypothetical protein
MNGYQWFPQAHRFVQNASRLLLGAFLLVTSFTLASRSALAQFAGPTQLTLVNGWTDAAFGTSHAMVEEANGIVQFRGALSGGSTTGVFTLPSGLWPATDVYIPVDMCNATNGRLHISSAGVADVEPETSFSDAQCFTSLDGASFAPKATGFTALTLINGWTNAPFSTSNAAVKIIGPKVYFKGAIATTGTNAEPFVLPAGFRPTTDVYVAVDLCNSTNGRLHITPNGYVDVEAEGGTFSNAQCFTSLDGAWFANTTAGFSSLPALQNGWTEAPFSTSTLQALDIYGTVFFKGAIASGTASQVVTLISRFRPLTAVYIPVDLCGATKGRVVIQPTGVMSVEAEGGTFSNAQCFTSLDGASFVY